MKIYVGIDLGSTTTKAVLLDDQSNVLGRGITNSRSNYDVACEVARSEALVDARFRLVRNVLEAHPELRKSGTVEELIRRVDRTFRREQHSRSLEHLAQFALEELDRPRWDSQRDQLRPAVEEVLESMRATASRLDFLGPDAGSDFFRDLAQSHWQRAAEMISKRDRVSFEKIMGVFDKTILVVENEPLTVSFAGVVARALSSALERAGLTDRADLERRVTEAAAAPLEEARAIGTGYGRQRLPFPKDCIRSEILCHGLGAHKMFPATATVLDIGGQDTKAIQVDGDGIVTSFQMNDRCAAGCGRYLGYIADEMNLGLHELGPLAQSSCSPVKINSTCTVFAGAELRDRLTLGQKREDILAGLHRAMILRAMSLLARSGGIDDEFTFTGGVAKNPAAVDAVRQLVEENYGERTINISPESIYTGALGAALFARHDSANEEAA